MTRRLLGWTRSQLRRKRVVVTLELVAVALLLLALSWAVRDVWEDAAPRLRHADLLDLAIALGVLAAYYLVFVLGWMRILRAYGIRISYPVALQAEMLSMLAKYIPGGVWTPAARVVALRRFGVRDTPVVLASILLEAGLSALAGIGVFIVGLALIGGADTPLLPLLAFGALVAFLVYPPGVRRRGAAAAAPVRRVGGAAAAVTDGARAAGVLRPDLAARRRRAVLHAALGRRRPGADLDPVPRRDERGRGDRRGALRLRSLGARGARGVDVRPDARRRLRGRLPRSDGAQPARDHGRRGRAPPRRPRHASAHAAPGRGRGRVGTRPARRR